MPNKLVFHFFLFLESAILVATFDFAFGGKGQGLTAFRARLTSWLVPHYEIASGIFIAAVKHFTFLGFSGNHVADLALGTFDPSFLFNV